MPLRRADHCHNSPTVCVCLILCDLETSKMPRPRTDMGCNATEKKKCHILRLTKKKYLAIDQEIFVRLLTEKTRAYIQVTLCGFCGGRSGRKRDFPLMLQLLCQVITPPMLCVLCLSNKDRPLAHNRPQFYRQITWPSQKIWNLWWTKWHCQRSFPECFTFPFSWLFHQCATHIHSSTVVITSS